MIHTTELISHLCSRKLEIVLEALKIVRSLDDKQIGRLASCIVVPHSLRDRYLGETCDSKSELYESMTPQQIARIALAIIRQDPDLEEQLGHIKQLDDKQLHQLAEIMIRGEFDAAAACRSNLMPQED